MNDEITIINLDTALDRVQSDKKFLLELLRDFERDFQTKRKVIEQAIDGADFEKIHQAVHFVKGAAGNIAADTIYNTCMIVENRIKYQDLEMVKELLHDIDRQFSELQEFIVKFKV